MAKRASEQRILQFREDIRNLRKRYSNGELAQRLNMDPANLSSYYSGRSKNPGADFLEKFYKTLKNEMEEIKNEQNSPRENPPYDPKPLPSWKTEDPATIYQLYHDREDHMSTLKMQTSHLQKSNDRLEEDLRIALENDNLHAKNYEKLISNNDRLITSNETLTATNNNLVNLYITVFQQNMPGITSPTPTNPG